MPELPEVQALAEYLDAHATGHTLVRLDVLSFQVLRTFDPPAGALTGRRLAHVGRRGKFLDLSFEQPGGPDAVLHLVLHLARAGWIHRRGTAPAPPRGRRGGPLALRLVLDDGSALDVTEQGTAKRLAAYVVPDPAAVPAVARLGRDALAADLTPGALLTLAAGSHGRLKTFLTDQSVLAGIGNAYSDEILHAARLSPYAMARSLDEEAARRLLATVRQVLEEALERARGTAARNLKAEKKAGLRVHGRTGRPCPVCGDTVRAVNFADSSLQYCPTCQTGGRVLADRRLSRLLK